MSICNKHFIYAINIKKGESLMADVKGLVKLLQTYDLGAR